MYSAKISVQALHSLSSLCFYIFFGLL